MGLMTRAEYGERGGLLTRLLAGSLLWLLLMAAPAPAADPCRPAAEPLQQGLGHLNRGEDAEALVKLSEAVALAPGCTRVYYPLGLSLERTGKHDRAVEAYSFALVPADPDYAAAYYRRGLAYGRKGHFDRETEDYSKATAIRPDIDTPLKAGVKTGRDPEIEAYTATIAADPDYAWAYYSRGAALRQKGRTQEAAEDFRRAVSLDKSHTLAYYHLGGSLRTLGLPDQAVETYNRALIVDPSLAWAHYNRGLILSRQGRYAAAAEDFSRALELDAAYAWAYFDRGYAYFREKKYRQASEDFDRAAAIAPEFPLVRRLRAAALNNQLQ